MSLDNIINLLFSGLDFFNKEKSSKFYINKKFIKNSNSSVLKIILPPRDDEKSLITKLLIWRLHKKGYSCLAYFFPRNILSSDVYHTIDNFSLIKDQIRLDIHKLKAEHNFQKIDLIAPSLGVVSACLIANDNDDISNLFLIVPGSCLASSLWNGIRTQKLKNIYESQNIKQEQLKNIWKDLAPKNNMNVMSNKKIFITISKSDKIIPYCFGKELANLVKKLYPDNTIIQENSHLGHYLTVLKCFLFSGELLK